MQLNDTPRVIARQWVLVLAVAALGAIGGYGFATSTATYSASSAVNVTGQVVVNADQAQMVTDYITSEMSVYESFASAPAVLKEAASTAGVNISPEDLHQATITESTGQTIQFTVTARSADQASRLADGLASVVAKKVNQLHVIPQDDQPITPVVIAAPASQLPSAASLTNSTLRTTTLGAILGLILGCGAAIVVHLLRGRVGSAAQLARATSEQVFASERGEPTSETAKRIKAVVEDGDLSVEPSLIVVTGVTDDEASAPLAGALATEFAADGMALSLVGSPAGASVNGIETQPLGELSKDSIERLAHPTTGLNIVMAPALATHADVLRLAKHADQVLVVVSKSEKLKATVRVGDMLRAAEAPLVGYVVT